MTVPRLLNTVILIVWACALLACGSDAPAGPAIRVEDAWSRPAVVMVEQSGGSAEAKTEMEHGKSATSAVYLKLVNAGREADRLVSARTDVAEVAEIHETRIEGEVMKMQHLPDGLEIPAQGQVELQPGGYHIMLLGLKQDLVEGDKVSLVLEFAKSGPITVEAMVRQP